MRRRTFLATLSLGLLTTPRTGHAQTPTKTARVGWVAGSAGPLPTSEYLDAFREGLRERGWAEGRNLVIEARWGDRDRARELAAELVRLKMDVLVAQGPMVVGVRTEAGAIPVVFGFSGDPVEGKLVASLARPGGNLTGLSFMSFELMGKRLELLKEALPRLVRVAVLANSAHTGEQSELRETRAAARRLDLTVQYLPVRVAGDFDIAFAAMTRERAEAIVAFPDGLIMSQASAIAAFAAKHRIPAVSGWAPFAERDNLMTYGPNLHESWRYVAAYVDRILRGAKPADLPVEQPTRFELVVNLKTAKALGLTLPQSILLRADRAIQ
ncbi:MAG: ABC transporter substrate-binding protein [Candidatus Rokuibacteriota bacterium]